MVVGSDDLEEQAPRLNSEPPQVSRSFRVRPAALRLPNAKEDFLGVVFRPGIAGRLGASFVVGAGGYHSDWRGELVGGVPKRLVLSLGR